MPDMWWRAVYDDDTVLEEVNGISSEVIDRDRLKRFELRLGAEDVVALEFMDRDKRLVFRRRTEVTNGVITGTVCLVGWNSSEGLVLWRVSEDRTVIPITPGPVPEVDLVPCEVL